MRCLSFLAILVLGVAGCSPPVMFRVQADEPIESGRLILNGRSADLMRNVDGAYWAKWDGADASGQIELFFAGGRTVRCEIGYVTNGLIEVQEFVVESRRCRQVS